MLFNPVKQMVNREGDTEQLKAQSQMMWVQLMNSIRNRAAEIVNCETIFS
ncbi:MAG: TnpV protein [Bacteroidales bacterium]|nr:TnpV protein [Bacteroidales bacterium]